MNDRLKTIESLELKTDITQLIMETSEKLLDKETDWLRKFFLFNKINYCKRKLARNALLISYIKMLPG